MRVKKLKLKNNLPVLLIENHKSPVVSVQMWVKTGSADENKAEAGISHFIEHLVFKGTQKFGVGEIASFVEASGGELNAYTSFDQTVFYVTISQHFSKVALETISEMMGFPKFDSAEIDNEREVVIEEIKRSNDSPSRQASKLLFSTIYKSHPYGIPVIGFDKIIRKVSRKKLVEYYNSRYVPANMLLVIAGDFKASEMQKDVKTYFDRLRPFKVKKVARKKEPAQKSTRVAALKAPFEEAQLHMAWRIPGAQHKDIAALEVLAMILGQGDSSRLVKKLRLDKAVVNSIGAGTFTPKDNGLFSVSATLSPKSFDECFALIADEVATIMTSPPSSEEIRKVIVNFESDEFYSLETVDAAARKAGSFETLMGDYDYFPKFLKKVQALTPGDISKAARKYLTPETLSIVAVSAQDKKETDKTLKIATKQYTKIFKKALSEKTSASETRALKKLKWTLPKQAFAEDATLERVKLKSGASVLFKANSSTPIFNARAAFLGGLRIEPTSQTGITEMLSRVWTTGTATLTEDEIARKTESMAASLSAFGGRNSAGLTIQSLYPFSADAIDLWADSLLHPSFASDKLEREKGVLQEQLKSRADSPSHLVGQMFIENIFAQHPYGRDPLGDEKTIASLNRDAIEAHWKKMVTAKNLIFSVVGCVDKEMWKERLEEISSHLISGSKLKEQFAYVGPKNKIESFKKLDREQSHIMIGYKGLTLDDPRRFALQVMQSVLSGQGGRLFLELRDKASLAYSVSPIRMEGIDAGYVGAYIGCSPEKGQKAISMLKEEFRKLMQENISDAELDRAKRYLIGRHDIDLQRCSTMGSALLFNEIYGIPAEEVFQYSEQLQSVDAKAVRELSQQLFSQPEVLAAVGPSQPW